MNGIDNLMYMSSTSDSAGSVTITLTFKSGTDPDIARCTGAKQTAAGHAAAAPRKYSSRGLASRNPVAASCWSPALSLITRPPPEDDISDYVASNVKDPISRLNGVGDVQLFGAQYAMRVWLDGNLLNKYNLTPVDVINALQVQNDQIAAGQLGGTPALKGQQLNASIIAQTRLKRSAGVWQGHAAGQCRWLCRPSERRRPH